MSTVGQQLTFTSNTTWTVPSDVGSIQIDCYGASGGKGGSANTTSGSNGQLGHRVYGNLMNCRGKTLTIFCGVQGGVGSGGGSTGNYYNGGGGGGGGSSAILVDGSLFFEAQGGGGGKGAYGNSNWHVGTGGTGGAGYVKGSNGGSSTTGGGGTGGTGGGINIYTGGTLSYYVNSGNGKVIITVLTLLIGKYLIQQNNKIYTLNPAVYGGTLPTNLQDLIVAKTLSEEQTALDVLTSTDIDNYATDNFDDVKQIRALFTGTKYKILKFKAQ